LTIALEFGIGPCIRCAYTSHIGDSHSPNFSIAASAFAIFLKCELSIDSSKKIEAKTIIC